jgi:hypothetical protein
MRPLAHAVPGAIAQLLRETPLSNGKAAFAWAAAVGPALDRATRVALDGTVLIVEVTSEQWARELERSRSVILMRLQALLGRDNLTWISIRNTCANQ